MRRPLEGWSCAMICAPHRVPWWRIMRLRRSAMSGLPLRLWRRFRRSPRAKWSPLEALSLARVRPLRSMGSFRPTWCCLTRSRQRAMAASPPSVQLWPVVRRARSQWLRRTSLGFSQQLRPRPSRVGTLSGSIWLSIRSGLIRKTSLLRLWMLCWVEFLERRIR